MATNVTDQRAKYVLRELMDLASRSSFVMDKMTNLSSNVRFGESLDIPHVQDFVVDANAASGTRRSVVNAALNLLVDRHPGIFLDIPAITRIQNLEGAWSQGIARQAAIQLANYMDDELVAFIVQELCADVAQHDNLAADDLTALDINNCIAAMLDQGGVQESNLAFFFNPYGAANFKSLAAYTPNFVMTEAGHLGIPQVATLYGIPVYQTSSVKRNREVAVTASEITSNVLTLTVASGHGIVAGQMLVTSGLDVDVAVAVAVTSVTATTIVLPLTAADDADNGTGNAVAKSCENLLVDTSHIFTAKQMLPEIRIVEREQSSSDEMQIFGLWGRQGRAGRARVLHSPAE